MISKSIAKLKYDKAVEEYDKLVKQHANLNNEKDLKRQELKEQGYNVIEINKAVSPIVQEIKRLENEISKISNKKYLAKENLLQFGNTDEKLKEIVEGLLDTNYGSSNIAKAFGIDDFDKMNKIILKNFLQEMPKNKLKSFVDKSYSKTQLRDLTNKLVDKNYDIQAKARQQAIEKYSEDGTLQGIPEDKRNEANKYYSKLIDTLIEEYYKSEFSEFFNEDFGDNELEYLLEDDIKTIKKLHSLMTTVYFTDKIVFSNGLVYYFNEDFGFVKSKLKGNYENCICDYSDVKKLFKGYSIDEIPKMKNNKILNTIKKYENFNYTQIQQINNEIAEASSYADKSNPTITINGVYINTDFDDKVELVATDSRALTIKEVNTRLTIKSCLIPTTFAKEKTSKFYGTTSEKISKSVFKDYEMYCFVIQYKIYPDYKRIDIHRSNVSVLKLSGKLPAVTILTAKGKNPYSGEKTLKKQKFYKALFKGDFKNDKSLEVYIVLDDFNGKVITEVLNNQEAYSDEIVNEAKSYTEINANTYIKKATDLPILDYDENVRLDTEVNIKLHSSFYNNAIHSNNYEFWFVDNQRPVKIVSNNYSTIIMPIFN